MKTINLLMPILMAVTLANAGCVAKYRTIHKAQAGEGAEDPKNSEDGNPAKPDAAPENPSAGLEIVFEGEIVTKVEAGDQFILQPTKDTLDPDNRNDDCTNPGIVSALYKASNGNILSAERDIVPTCDKGLEVKHSIATPGTYIITLQVKTDEGETAEATGTLIVTAKGASSTSQGGLVVKGDPLIVQIDETVNFSAVCADGKNVTITWDFGDDSAGNGKKTTHSYSTLGSKIAKAKCVKPGMDDMWGSVTIVVLPKDETDTATGDDDGSDGSSTNVPADGGDGDDDGSSTNVPPPSGDDGDGDSGDDGSEDGNDDNGDDDGDDDKTPPGKPNTPGQNPGQSPHQTK